MKKKFTILLFGAMLGLTLTGCQNSQPSEKTTEAPEAATEAAPETEELSETEATLEPITPSDYLVSDAASYVKLGDYTSIPVEKTVYEITDDTIQERIQEELEAYATEQLKEGAAEEGDVIYASLTYTLEGSDETVTEEDFFTTIGYEEFGAEFDQQLVGAVAGDSLSFSVDYTEDDMMIDWAGKTVDFTVDIDSVYSLIVPEYNDDFILSYTDYDSREDYEAYIRETLEQEYEESSYSDAVDSLFAAALDRTEFTGYPQELYDSCKAETLEVYMAFVGEGTEEEVCDMLGITDEDLDADVLSTVNQRLLVSAYCLANDITVTEDEYVSFVEEYAYYYGEPDAVSFEEYYGRESLVWALYESKFSESLYEKAEITEVPYDPDEFAINDFEIDEFADDELDASVVEGDPEEDSDTADTEEDTDASGDAKTDASAEDSTEAVTDSLADTGLEAETE